MTEEIKPVEETQPIKEAKDPIKDIIDNLYAETVKQIGDIKKQPLTKDNIKTGLLMVAGMTILGLLWKEFSPPK